MKLQQGFSLIELMIVIAIVAILASVAIPSYNDHVVRGKRAKGKAFIMDIASMQERFFTENISYANGFSTTATSVKLNTSDTGADGTYTITITGSPAGCAAGGATPCTGYSLAAAPAGGHSDPDCGSLVYNHLGQKSVTGTASKEECWR